MTHPPGLDDPETLLYTVQEVAMILKVDPRTVYRYIHAGHLTAIRFSARKTRIRRRDLLTFINQAPSGQKETR